jgi:PAS domain-containing protein
LQESQDFIQQMADACPGILYIFDLNTQRTIYINRQINQVLGYTQNIVEQMGAEFTKQLMHPEDRLRLVSHLEQFHSSHPGEVLNFDWNAY